MMLREGRDSPGGREVSLVPIFGVVATGLARVVKGAVAAPCPRTRETHHLTPLRTVAVTR